MDLVGYDREAFESARENLMELAAKTGFEGQEITLIPIAAKDGDNVVFASLNMDWYVGETLLEQLENTRATRLAPGVQTRFPVQFVIRPHSDEYHDFRGYAGRISSGSLKQGDEVSILPSQKATRIRSILVHDELRAEANEKESVVLTLEDDFDITRGDMIVRMDEGCRVMNSFEANLCWMDEASLVPGRFFLLQHGTNRVKAKVTVIHSVVNMQTLDEDNDKKVFGLNDIGRVGIQAARPIFADPYEMNPSNGSFILIDEFSNSTVAVGFVL
jgi:sulfate adenylyltransferase subunit 1